MSRMRALRIPLPSVTALLAVPALVLALILFATYSGYSADGGLTGTVTSSDGAALGGVAVSARADATHLATTVYTDENGRYYFPQLKAGQYQMTAQAVGFETARAARALDGASGGEQDFQLSKLEDFSLQLSGTEWMAALPEDTPEHRRMKMIFRNNCAGCHTPNFVLQNRFDEAGWRSVITLMAKIGIYGDPPRPDREPSPLIDAFRDELAAYLAEMRGPGPSPMKFEPFPRPRGESAQVVVTEYDITANSNLDDYVTQDGSNWMEGVPSAYEARGPHDITVDPQGIVWAADSQINPARTIFRLDPNTGEVKNYRLEGRHGRAKRSHGIFMDDKGMAWFNADGGLGKINTKTEHIEFFEPPQEMARVGGTIDVGPDGTVWASTDMGALAFDPVTNTFKEFKSLRPGNQGRTYGVAVDSEGNGWWAQMGYDVVGKGNLRTGEVTEVVFDRLEHAPELATTADRELYEKIGGEWNSAPTWQHGPRRLGGDRAGNMWVALWWSDRLAKIDIHTNEVTYYPYPNKGFAGVYDTMVDSDGMVWINLMHADRIARFNPSSDEWTEFPLPTVGTETRYIMVDDRDGRVEPWVAYWRSNKIARLQFRTQQQLQTLAQR